MTLRTRLLLGYAYLVALLLLVAISAATALAGLGRGIEGVLEENFRSVAASYGMLEALEREDSETLALLLAPGASRDRLLEHEKAFSAALQRVRDNVTIESERPIIQQVRQRYAAYRVARDLLLELRHDHPLADYQSGTQPAFAAVKAQVRALADVNEAAMVAAGERARRSADRSGAWVGALASVALLSLLVLSRRLQRDVLGRLSRLGRAAGELAPGERTRRPAVDGDDELGRIARRLNEALDAVDAERSRADGLVAQSRQILLGLLAAWPEPAAVLALDGRLVASTLPPADEQRVCDLAAAALRAAEETPRPLTLPDGAWRLVPLLAAGVRQAGWLVAATTPAASTSSRPRSAGSRGPGPA